MVRASFLLAALVLMGCGSPLRAATETANGVKIATLTASEVIDETCVKEVQKLPSATEEEKAASRALLAEIKTVCGPMVGAYKMARLSHAVLVAAIAAGESQDLAKLAVRTYEAAQAAAKLADAIDRARKSQ